jgi:hypothetical protein|tara:strand:+ start:319 stop:1338 length:1020 start_codon:yes stop_codon:yes gene_type:complete
MTTYKDIRGTHITTVTTDPPAPVNGQMWYNSTDKVMKGFVSNPVGAWATGNNMNTSRGGHLAGVGTQTACIGFGGETPGGYQAVNESYNGTSWTEVADLNTGRANLASAGASYTAGLAIGGLNTSQPEYNLKVVESWDGSSWTEVGDLNTQRYDSRASGTNTAALAFGGAQFPTGPAPGTKALTESWNGSSWTEVADLNTARNGLMGFGNPYTASIAAGGSTPTAILGVVESWNGSAWTETTDLNQVNQLSGDGGTSTDGIIFGGRHPPSSSVGRTEVWDGSSWTEVSDLNSARRNLGSAHSAGSSANLGFGGNPGSGTTAATEEFTSPATSTVTFTAS